MKHSRLAYTVQEAAEAASVGRTLIYEQIGKGLLAARKVGRRTLITADDLETWLARLPQKIVNRTEGGAA
jgi:excisionase family DNA binding protein